MRLFEKIFDQVRYINALNEHSFNSSTIEFHSLKKLDSAPRGNYSEANWKY